MAGKIRIGIVGVGNCASGLIEGIEYYRQHPEREVVGIMHRGIGGYDVRDIEVVCAFDVDRNKVGKTLDEALDNIKDAIRGWIEVEKRHGRFEAVEPQEIFLGEVTV